MRTVHAFTSVQTAAICNLADNLAPLRSVDDDTGQASGHDTGDWEGDEPTKVDPGNHSPVDGSPGTGAESDADGGTGDTLGGGDGEGEAGGHDNGDGGAKFHGETARWGVESDAVTELAHDVVAVEPETQGESDTAIGENPDGDGGLGGDLVGLPDEEYGGERADGAERC